MNMIRMIKLSTADGTKSEIYSMDTYTLKQANDDFIDQHGVLADKHSEFNFDATTAKSLQGFLLA